MADDVIEELQESLLQFRVEDPNTHLILVATQKCIDSGKLNKLADVLTCPDNKDTLEFVGWELIGVICQAFVYGTDVSVLEECRKILEVIALTCSAKEVCIGVLEQLDRDTTFSLERFVVLLDMLKMAVNRMKEKKLKCLSMVLPCVLQNIRNIKISDEVIEKSSNEDTDEKGQVMLHSMKSVLEFLRPLVQEVNVEFSCSSKSSSSSYITGLQQEVLKCLIELLDYPVVYLDLAKESNEMVDSEDKDNHESDSDKELALSASPYRQLAQEIMQFIQMTSCSYVNVYLMEYTWKMCQMPDKINKTVEDKPGADEQISVEEDLEAEEKETMTFPTLGLSCFVYLLLVEEMELMNFPAVFSFNYLLRVNMKNVLFLLRRTEHCAINKGLKLLDALSRRLKEKSMVYRHDEFKDITEIVKALINVMTMCSSRKLRSKGVRVFPNFVSKLDTKSQYGLLYTFLQDCSHAGVAGLLIYLLKEQVNQALCSSGEEPWFQGTRFMSIFQLVLRLPSKTGTEKDLVQETDRIMGALNCLRFILLRDKCDKTTAWKNFKTIETNFVDPLRETLKVTRIQYQAELLSKRDEMTGNKREEAKEDIEFNIKSPDGKSLEMMPVRDQCEALQSGLYSLDMMESVVARISEIANSRSKEGK
ncbi:unnamed protein product [Porites lobata]|uniref:Glomulin n=1 Tax=Porites lobata TaxID=104759 RepID=A0ABN8N8J5_9CNID|nr:unnamed protein product [Porites lobata]